MGYGIKDFYTAATSRGFARNNVFRIKSVSDNVFQEEPEQELMIYTKEGIIPSRVISTGKVSYKSFDFVVPLQASYPENQGWNVTFYSDQEFILRGMLERWSKGTFNEHGQFSIANFTRCDFEIALLDVDRGWGEDINENTDARETAVYKLNGCFPTAIGSVSYNNTSSGEIVSLQTSIAFQYVESYILPLI